MPCFWLIIGVHRKCVIRFHAYSLDNNAWVTGYLLLLQLGSCRELKDRLMGEGGAQINNIPRWAKWIVFVRELNLMLPCFGLWSLKLPPPDFARQPGNTPPPHTQSMSIYFLVMVGSILNEDALRPPPPSFLSRYVIYLWVGITDSIASLQQSTLFCYVLGVVPGNSVIYSN